MKKLLFILCLLSGLQASTQIVLRDTLIIPKEQLDSSIINGVKYFKLKIPAPYVAPVPTARSVNGTSDKITLADNNNAVRYTFNSSTSGVTVVIPSGLPVGFKSTFYQEGTASIRVIAESGSGVTVQSFKNYNRSKGAGARLTIEVTADKKILLCGDLKL